MKTRISPKSANLPPVGTVGSAGLANLPKLPFSEFGSQSNTSSESSQSVAFRIGTNQTHPLVYEGLQYGSKRSFSGFEFRNLMAPGFLCVELSN